jgi:hypothetical protein
MILGFTFYLSAKNIIRIFGGGMMQGTPSAEKCRTGATPKTEPVFIKQRGTA